MFFKIIGVIQSASQQRPLATAMSLVANCDVTVDRIDLGPKDLR